ncbi:MAG: hypothetical protein LBL52_03985 [Rickettsiales bacterium]|jgi:hypothetical protein|nr:hypothetical protein [Rickettsiales bacterium]
MKMKKIAMFIAAFALAACSSTSDTLFGSEASSKPAASAPAASEGAFGGTFVKNKIANFKAEQGQMRSVIEGRRSTLQSMRAETNTAVSDYRTTVAQISAKLQMGTTPGNPELMDQWRSARSKLERINEIAFDIKRLVADIESDTSMVDYMVGSIQASYKIRGATEDDHKQLRALEEEAKSLGGEIATFARQADKEAERQMAYVDGEKSNLNDLALNIKNGKLYGAGSSRDFFADGGSMFSSDESYGAFVEDAARDYNPSAAPSTPVSRRDSPVGLRRPAGGPVSLTPAAGAASVGSARPIVSIKFDRPDVEFEEPLYQALSRALERNPSATFEVSGVTPRGKSAAESQKHVKGVTKALADMGLPASRVALTSTTLDVPAYEVRVFEK